MDAAGVRQARWAALGGCCLLYFSFGAAIGVMAPLVDEMMADLNLSRSRMGSILGAWSLLYIVTSIPLGAFVDRIGVRRSLLLGGGAVAASLALRSVAVDGLTLFGAVAVFGLGGPLVSVGAPKLVSLMFDDDERRLPTGLIVAAPGLGSVATIALTNPVLLPLFEGSWRGAVALTAAVAFAALIAWPLLSSAIAGEDGAAPSTRPSIPQLLRVPALRWVLAIAIPHFFLGHSFNNWMVEILTDLGWSDNAAGWLTSLGFALGIGGSLTIARLVAPSRRALVLAVIYAVLAAGALALATAWQPAVVGAIVGIGVLRGGVIPLLFLILMDDPEIGSAGTGGATGLFFGIGQIGAWAGPVVTGAVADATGGFRQPLLVLAAVAGAGLALSLLMHRRRAAPVQVAKT